MIQNIKLQSPLYPKLLAEIYDPPNPVYFQGNPDLLQKTCLSIVGTRRSTEYGESITRKIVEDLAVLDVAIVSGLARGIDAIAHQSAIENGLPTIAVLGSGIENIYPSENHDLACSIIENGLIISQFPGKTEPTTRTFPQRNRIISGLSIATIIIEAPEKSGSLITARFALDQGREIFVVPGDVDRLNSLGIIRLLQRGGAYPIASGKDILEILGFKHSFSNRKKLNETAQLVKIPQPNKQSPLPFKLNSQEKMIMDLFPTRSGLNLPRISQKVHLPINSLLSTISGLEIKGLIVGTNGKYYRKY